MIKRSNQKVILEPEYAFSNDRMMNLRDIVIDGEDADAVLKYINRFKTEFQTGLLQMIEENKSKQVIDNAEMEYRIICRFCDMLEQASLLGRQKLPIYRELSNKQYK